MNMRETFIHASAHFGKFPSCLHWPPDQVPPWLFSEVCQDTIPDWADASGADCSTYSLMKWCTISGEYGTGWETAWGLFSQYSSDGGSATDYCCACGGGSTKAAEGVSPCGSGNPGCAAALVRGLPMFHDASFLQKYSHVLGANLIHRI